MGSNFFSPPSKRPLMSDSTAAPNAALSSAAKRFKPQQKSPTSVYVPPGYVAFRLLCHSSRISAIIGRAGSVIKQLQLETSSKIRVEDSLTGSEDRVIVIIAGSSPIKRLKLGRPPDFSEEYELSSAQEAALRVYEKILDVAAEMSGVNVAALGVEVVSCRLLVDTSQASFLIGKGGKVVEKMRKESGSKIKILMGDRLPTGVAEGDEVVQIEGDILAVKKGLLGVTRRIQDCPASDRPKIMDSNQTECVSISSMRDFHDDILPQKTLVLPHLQTSPIKRVLDGHSTSFGDDRFSAPETIEQKPLTFRMLCLADRVGGIIGRAGSVIKALQEETGVTISIGPLIADCDERLVTITSLENPELRYSPGQRALILLFTRYIESIIQKGLDTGSSKGSVCARLLVPLSEAGCLIGKGGVIISEMRIRTGAAIRVIKDKLPKCASENDEVIEITGEFVNVQDAVHQVSGRLRDNLFSKKTPAVSGSKINASPAYEMNPYERLRDHVSIGSRQTIETPLSLHRCTSTSSSSVYERSLYDRSMDPVRLVLHHPISISQSRGRNVSLLQGMDHPELFNRLDHSSSPVSLPSQQRVSLSNNLDIGRGFTAATGRVELGSGSRPTIITNTTVEILVPEYAIRSVYGENGNNLARMRKISGAKVVVNEPGHGSRDRIVTISGTPDEAQAAQSLLHAFILTG